MNESITTPSMLTRLRALIPPRRITLSEALRIAEQQAARMLIAAGVNDWPVPDGLLAGLPRLRIEYVEDMPTSGCSFWDSDRRTWVMQINLNEPVTRQRFTLLHEYKHIIDHGRAALLYGETTIGQQWAERAADYFAGCALIPRPLLKRAWANGLQGTDALAHAFGASPQAVTVRLAQIGLSEPLPRCTPPVSRSPAGRWRRYDRAFSIHRPLVATLGQGVA